MAFLADNYFIVWCCFFYQALAAMWEDYILKLTHQVQDPLMAYVARFPEVKVCLLLCYLFIEYCCCCWFVLLFLLLLLLLLLLLVLIDINIIPRGDCWATFTLADQCKKDSGPIFSPDWGNNVLQLFVSVFGNARVKWWYL